MLKTVVPNEPDFCKMSQENTKGIIAFKNCILYFNRGISVPFDPKFYFTFKTPNDHKEHYRNFEMDVRKVVCENICGEGDKSEFL